MAVSSADIALLTKVVGKFENGGGDPYIGVTGDFDGQGISCGVLQWNIGQGSLQPMVKALGQPKVTALMPGFGAQMWTAVNASLSQGLAIVRSWQVGSKLKAAPAAELRALMGDAAMRKLQDDRIQVVADQADHLAAAWATARGASARTQQELVWFFDVVTQNGGMKGLTFADVKAFKTSAGPGKADDLICDWLAGVSSAFWGYKDSHVDATRWRNTLTDGPLDLLVLGYLRSQKSTLKARADVLNRKGTLAARKGKVHGEEFDFTGIF